MKGNTMATLSWSRTTGVGPQGKGLKLSQQFIRMILKDAHKTLCIRETLQRTVANELSRRTPADLPITLSSFFWRKDLVVCRKKRFLQHILRNPVEVKGRGAFFTPLIRHGIN